MTEELFIERRRAGRRRRVIRVLLGLLAAGVVGGLVWLIWFSSALAVNRIQVEGTTTLKPADIRSQADVRFGQPLVRVDTVAIEHAPASTTNAAKARSRTRDLRWRLTMVSRRFMVGSLLRRGSLSQL